MTRNRFFPITHSSLGQSLLPLAMVLAVAFTGHSMAEDKTEGAGKKPEWKSLFDGKTLKNWQSSNFGGEGNVAVENGMIVLSQGSDMTGVTWTGDELPRMNYEVVVTAQRIEGNDFFCGMTFEVDKDPCSLIIGGWGGGIVGISSLDGLDAANNETARYESFERGKWYKIRLRVAEQGLMAWIDDKQVVSVSTKGRKISIRGEVEPSRPFGISCYATTAGLKDIKIRNLTEEEAKAPLIRTEEKKEKAK
ncbi:DUF1080 domain-containing protein [Schlesneria sp. T3-172]|uniref:3-keto-disaccharide hydrolase n=1 Tax=Schlesneria sphaerica TaxID=3373610 RepID=UPI0037C8542F